MIKAIIFDSGGVIVNQRLFFERLNKIFQPKDRKKFWHEINIKAIPLCKNQISEYEFWKRIANSTDAVVTNEVPKNLWTKDYEKLTSINQDVLDIIKKLKQKYKLVLVSNSIKSHEKINRRRGFFKLFDMVVLSHKVNLTKDNKDIFLLATEKLKIKPEECIFIDDVKDFVDIAKSTGMKGIIFKNSKKLKASLRKFVKFH